jgi:metal-sulfur cluster biosynthetic enzyme
MTEQLITEDRLWSALRTVMDPELGCNLVDLGLIYSLAIQGPRVAATMTLTTPGCPMHESLAEGVRLALLQVDGVADAQVDVVWDPPWNPSMMTAAGRNKLGMN